MKNNNKLLFLSTFILLFTMATFAYAEEALKLKPGHPQEYTVQKGDTLWDISGKFLNNPWQWPEIWQINKQIKNPHLIYPGDVLHLVYIDGKPYLTRDKYGKRTVKLSPETRVEELDQAIPTIPLDAIAPYLTRNRILNAGEYFQLPYVVGIADEHLSAATGNLVYVAGLPEDNNDAIYGFYRRGDVYRRLTGNKEVLGYESIYLGEGSLAQAGDPAKILIEKSKAEILKKHRVIPIVKDRIVDANFLPKASSLKRSANIVGVLTVGIQPGVNLVGSMDVVIIDAGIKDGIEAGDVLNIYKKGAMIKDPIRKDKMIRLPDEHAGNLMVFRPFNQLSYALVMDAQSSLRVGDTLKSPLNLEQ